MEEIIMNVPSKSELVHLKIQAAMRENCFDEDQMKYLGVRDDEHWYLIAGEHEVPVSAIEDFEFDGYIYEEEDNA
jgi:hypothetical protein